VRKNRAFAELISPRLCSHAGGSGKREGSTCSSRIVKEHQSRLWLLTRLKSSHTSPAVISSRELRKVNECSSVSASKPIASNRCVAAIIAGGFGESSVG